MNHLGPMLTRQCGSPVRRIVVDDNGFVDKKGHALQDLYDPDFFIEAGDNNGDAAAFVHGNRSYQNRRWGDRQNRIAGRLMPLLFYYLDRMVGDILSGAGPLSS
jgi:hypothetical protein